jgi:membrane carboxypeptidase/penicillin-binding protein
MSPGAAYLTTRVLQDVLAYGTARSLKGFAEQRPAAGKTGTTDDYRDAWFIGYTPQLITGVWVGHDTPKPGGKGFTGGAVAAPIWERFMRAALAAAPSVDFLQPENVTTVVIDPATGFRATSGCPQQREEYYLIGTEPAGDCPEHGGTPVSVEPVVPTLPVDGSP